MNFWCNAAKCVLINISIPKLASSNVIFAGKGDSSLISRLVDGELQPHVTPQENDKISTVLRGKKLTFKPTTLKMMLEIWINYGFKLMNKNVFDIPTIVARY